MYETDNTEWRAQTKKGCSFCCVTLVLRSVSAALRSHIRVATGQPVLGPERECERYMLIVHRMSEKHCRIQTMRVLFRDSETQ